MDKKWYIIHTYTGYESKIEHTLHLMLDAGELSPEIVTQIRVPTEEVVEVKNEKKITRNNKILPGYIMLELDLPQLGWKDTCSKIRRIQGVTGFVGTNPNVRPHSITTDEAKNLLQRSGEIKGEKQIHVKQSFSVGDQVKITDGAFATFTGTVEEISPEKDKMRVMVQIFGRAAPVEVSLLQAEKIL